MYIRYFQYLIIQNALETRASPLKFKKRLNDFKMRALFTFYIIFRENLQYFRKLISPGNLNVINRLLTNLIRTIWLEIT